MSDEGSAPSMVLGDMDVPREIETLAQALADQAAEIAALRMKVEQLGIRLAGQEQRTSFLGVSAPRAVQEGGR